MKKILFFCFSVLYAVSLSAQSGKVLESLKFESKKVSYPVEYSIYLPPDYETSARSYPVLYLLHGYSDDETGWIQFGEANIIADRGIANGDFPPCIIVMPDGKVSWYCNSADGKDPLRHSTVSVRERNSGPLQVFRWEATGHCCFRCAIPICFRRAWH